MYVETKRGHAPRLNLYPLIFSLTKTYSQDDRRRRLLFYIRRRRRQQHGGREVWGRGGEIRNETISGVRRNNKIIPAALNTRTTRLWSRGAPSFTVHQVMAGADPEDGPGEPGPILIFRPQFVGLKLKFYIWYFELPGCYSTGYFGVNLYIFLFLNNCE